MGISIGSNNIASWNGNSWNILGTNSTNNGVGGVTFGNVNALAMNGTNNLFVGGYFGTVDGGSIASNSIASWNGNSWNILGTDSTNNGVDNTVLTLAISGITLIVGGLFTNYYGTTGLSAANYVAFWNGNSTWSVLGNMNPGVNGAVYALAMSGDYLFVEFDPNIFHEFPFQEAI